MSHKPRCQAKGDSADLSRVLPRGVMEQGVGTLQGTNVDVLSKGLHVDVLSEGVNVNVLSREVTP